MPRVLFITTSSDRKGKIDQPTGVWYEELAAPYNYFTSLGYEVVLSSIKGGKIPIDPASLAEGFKTEDVDLFLENKSAVEKLENSVPIDAITVTEFDAVFIPGGLGVMYDMPENETLAKHLSEAWAQGKVVSAVCHGPGALLSAKTQSGEALIKGKQVTGFTNTEEEATGNTKNLDYLLEDKMKELGGLFDRGPDWTSFALQDGNLVTGQNPQSSKKVAELVVSLLKGSN
eukprot:g2947.t1